MPHSSLRRAFRCPEFCVFQGAGRNNRIQAAAFVLLEIVEFFIYGCFELYCASVVSQGFELECNVLRLSDAPPQIYTDFCPLKLYYYFRPPSL